MVVVVKGGMSPAGGLTRNLWGEEVWTLKATGAVGVRELSMTFARHLRFRAKSMRISWSDTSDHFSMVTNQFLTWEMEETTNRIVFNYSWDDS